METLDFDLLRTLVVIASQGSFAAASVQLGRTQSAITQQMQRLEEKIGHPLFEKQGRHKRLSDHGERLLGYARHLLAIHDEALRNLQQRQVQGLVRIGAPHDAADTLLPPVLREMAQSFPGMQIDIHVGRSPFLMESLKQGELDMAISNRADDTLEGFVLRSSPTVWLCGAGFVHDPSRPLPLVLADGPSIFRRLGCEALDAAGIAWTTGTPAPAWSASAPHCAPGWASPPGAWSSWTPACACWAPATACRRCPTWSMACMSAATWSMRAAQAVGSDHDFVQRNACCDATAGTPGQSGQIGL